QLRQGGSLTPVQCALQDGGDDGAADLHGNGFTAVAGGPTDPAGVEHEDPAVAVLDAPRQQVRVYPRRPRQPGLPLALFRQPCPRAVAGEEMVGGGFPVEDRHRRQDAGGIPAQQQDVAGLPGALATELIDGKGAAGRGGSIQPAALVQLPVFHEGAEARGGTSGRQGEQWPLATARQVEQPVPSPAEARGAHQGAARACGEGPPATAGGADEKCHIAVVPDAGDAFEGQDALLRQEETLHRQQRAVQLPGGNLAGDHQFAAGDMDDHQPFAGGRAVEGRGVEQFPLLLGGGVVAGRGDQQVAGEQAVPGGFAGDFYGDVVLGVLADRQVGDEALPLAEVPVDPVPEGVELLEGAGPVALVPGNGVGGARLVDDEALAGAPGGRGNHQGALCGACPFTAL